MPTLPSARPTIRGRFRSRYPAGARGDGGLRLAVSGGIIQGALDYEALVEDPNPNAGNYTVAALNRATGEYAQVGLDAVETGSISIADVTDATPTGQSIVTAATPANVRSTIGAASMALATTSNPGLLDASGKTKLDGLPTGSDLTTSLNAKLSNQPSAFNAAIGPLLAGWLGTLPTTPTGLTVGSWWNNGGTPAQVTEL